jgi:hypothetical protein
LKYTKDKEDIQLDSINSLSLRIYNYVIDANSHIDWFGVNYFIEYYNIKDSEYLIESIYLIKNTINNYSTKFEENLKKGKQQQEQVVSLLKSKGLKDGNTNRTKRTV